MLKGEIWLDDLNPRRGSEQSGLRPIVIISGNSMNTHFDLVITCPFLTKIKNFIGNLVIEPSNANGLKQTSELLIFQIRTIAKNRLINRIGILTDVQIIEIEEQLLKILKY